MVIQDIPQKSFAGLSDTEVVVQGIRAGWAQIKHKHRDRAGAWQKNGTEAWHKDRAEA